MKTPTASRPCSAWSAGSRSRHEREGLLPRDLLEVAAAPQQRPAQAVGVGVELADRDALRAQVAAREDVRLVARHREHLAPAHLEREPAGGLAERADAEARLASRERHLEDGAVLPGVAEARADQQQPRLPAVLLRRADRGRARSPRSSLSMRARASSHGPCTPPRALQAATRARPLLRIRFTFHDVPFVYIQSRRGSCGSEANQIGVFTSAPELLEGGEVHVALARELVRRHRSSATRRTRSPAKVPIQSAPSCSSATVPAPPSRAGSWSNDDLEREVVGADAHDRERQRAGARVEPAAGGDRA